MRSGLSDREKHTAAFTCPTRIILSTLNPSHTNMVPRVSLTTGGSTGFGEEFVKAVLQKGDYVDATARNNFKLSFDGANDSNSLFVDLDVTKREPIDKAFDAAIKKFGKVDVVCNNAGYGLNGPFETSSEK
ncbi:hypothetical protein ACET3X_005822 [Alternaria dauci]|uniref:NAD(P)-binding protein n=1 Tax=Alternaria dauci TaxID=48095 RepID=A0ABR3UHV9_9PLEO